MNAKAQIENVKTLASALGIDENKAMQLLDVSVAVTYEPTNKEDSIFASHVERIISRTVTKTFGMDSNSSGAAVELVVGEARPRISAKRIYACFDATEVRIGEIKTKHHPKSARPIGLLLGACYAVGAMLKSAFDNLLPFPSAPMLQINLEELFGDDLDCFDGIVDFGEVVLAGAGAIGNGFVYALSQIQVKGTLDIVDDDVVSEGNLQRCLFFGEPHIGFNKCDCLRDLISARLPLVTIRSHKARLQNVEFRKSGAWLKRLVVAVDSPRARRALQGEIPGEVFDASTTGIEEVVFHFNKQPTDLACLSCAYHESPEEAAHEQHVAEALGVSVAEVKRERISPDAAQRIKIRYPDVTVEEISGTAFDTLFKQLCGAQKLRTPEGKQVLAPFAFVSVMAGTILAMEFIRRVARSNKTIFNDWALSPWTNPIIRRRRLQAKRSDCEFCGNETISRVAKSIWAQGQELR